MEGFKDMTSESGVSRVEVSKVDANISPAAPVIEDTQRGIVTSEFWVGVVVPQILAIGIVMGWVTPEQVKIIVGDDLAQIVSEMGRTAEILIGAIVSLISAWRYVGGRISLKKEKLRMQKYPDRVGIQD